MGNAYGYDDKQTLTHLEEKKLKRIMTALALVSGLALTGCADDGYDDPEATSVELATAYYNETAQENGDPRLSLEKFEENSKQYVCDLLPSEPTEDDLVEHSQFLAEMLDIEVGTALSLVIHGSGRWCGDKYDSAFGDE